MPLPPPRPSRAPAAPAELVSTINRLSAGFAGKKGIAVRAVDDGWTVEVGGRQRLPQQSVSKLWVAITLLDLRDRGRARLDEPIVVRREDLTLFHQPIAMLVKGDGYHTTVGELLNRALTMSDNTANDRLLTYVGGPQAVRAMIANKRLGDIRFGPASDCSRPRPPASPGNRPSPWRVRSRRRATGSIRRRGRRRSMPMSTIRPMAPRRSPSPMHWPGWRVASCCPKPRPAS